MIWFIWVCTGQIVYTQTSSWNAFSFFGFEYISTAIGRIELLTHNELTKTIRSQIFCGGFDAALSFDLLIAYDVSTGKVAVFPLNINLYEFSAWFCRVNVDANWCHFEQFIL